MIILQGSYLANSTLPLMVDESNHARLDAISKNEAFLNMCRKSLADERAAAEQWSEKQKAEGQPISTRYAFDDRSEEDRTVIAYRDMKGW